MSLQRSAGNSVVVALLAKKGFAQKGIEGEDEPIKEEGGGPAVEERAVDGEKRSALDDAAEYADASVQLQAPPPPLAAPPPSVAAVTYLPTLMDQTPAGWGVTIEDDVIVDITAYSAGPAWKCVVSTATQQNHQGVRLLPGVSECTAAAVSGADCATLKTMKTSLNDVADQKAHSGWYMKAAVQAHEDLHNTQYRGGLNPAFTTYKTAVEALSVPAAAAADAGAAKTAIKALAGYTTARATLHAADVAANNATASHSPVAPFNAAEHGVVDPMITTIDARRTAKSCPP